VIMMGLRTFAKQRTPAEAWLAPDHASRDCLLGGRRSRLRHGTLARLRNLPKKPSRPPGTIVMPRWFEPVAWSATPAGDAEAKRSEIL
jgi:hypothetical protein